MSALAHLAMVSSNAPPQLTIPSFDQAVLGWLLGLAVLLGPLVLSFMSWQRRKRQWWALLTQWRSLGFWLLLGGTLVAAMGMFGLLGIIPAWQAHWTAWYLDMVRLNPSADLTTLGWNTALQQQYAFALQVSTAIIFLVGLVLIFAGQQRLTRALMEFHGGPDDWLLTLPEQDSTAAPTGKALNHPYSTQH